MSTKKTDKLYGKKYCAKSYGKFCVNMGYKKFGSVIYCYRFCVDLETDSNDLVLRCPNCIRTQDEYKSANFGTNT